MCSPSKFPECNGVLFYTAKSLSGWDGLLFWVGVAIMQMRVPKYVHTALYVDGCVVNLVDDGIEVIPSLSYDPSIITFVPYFVSPPWDTVVYLMDRGCKIRWSDIVKCFVGLHPSGLVCTSFVSLFVEHSRRGYRVNSADDLYRELHREPKSTE